MAGRKILLADVTEMKRLQLWFEQGIACDVSWAPLKVA
jgi:hypothetical protein